MVFLKVQRRDFNQLKQTDLAIFAQMVVSKVSENAVYQAINPQIIDLKTTSLTYDQALVAATNRDKELVKLKNISKQNLLDSFNLFSNVLEVNAQGSKDYIIGTGLSILPKPIRSNLPKIAPAMPTNVFMKSTGNVGELNISFLLPNKEHTLNVGVEHRIANTDIPYQNGTYFNKEEGLLQHLPPQSYVEVRMRALGRDNLKSEWTTPIVVPVL